MTKKDINGLKGAIRRTFARSELYQSVIEAFRVEHSDPNRPRCRKWVWCNVCGEVIPEWTSSVDHIEPVVPIDRHFEDMPIAESIDRMWCERNNLQVICAPCHDVKTRAENQARKPYKKPIVRRKKK